MLSPFCSCSALSPVLGAGDTDEQDTAWGPQLTHTDLHNPFTPEHSRASTREAGADQPSRVSGKASLRRYSPRRRMRPLSKGQGRARREQCVPRPAVAQGWSVARWRGNGASCLISCDRHFAKCSPCTDRETEAQSVA